MTNNAKSAVNPLPWVLTEIGFELSGSGFAASPFGDRGYSVQGHSLGSAFGTDSQSIPLPLS
jgi:hypothetical protein